jgi:hypothetical protein
LRRCGALSDRRRGVCLRARLDIGALACRTSQRTDKAAVLRAALRARSELAQATKHGSDDAQPDAVAALSQ